MCTCQIHKHLHYSCTKLFSHAVCAHCSAMQLRSPNVTDFVCQPCVTESTRRPFAAFVNLFLTLNYVNRTSDGSPLLLIIDSVSSEVALCGSNVPEMSQCCAPRTSFKTIATTPAPALFKHPQGSSTQIEPQLCAASHLKVCRDDLTRVLLVYTACAMCGVVLIFAMCTHVHARVCACMMRVACISASKKR